MRFVEIDVQPSGKAVVDMEKVSALVRHNGWTLSVEGCPKLLYLDNATGLKVRHWLLVGDPL